MDLLLNFGLAWVSVILAIFLSIIYVLRILRIENLNRLNKSMRKHHKLLGVLLIITGVVHGLFSSESVLSFNLGTVAWVVSILLGVNWMLRKHFAKLKGWMHYHRVLTAVFLLMIVWHVVDVGGIQVQKVLFDAPVPVAYGVSESTPDSAAVEDSSDTASDTDIESSSASTSEVINDEETLGYLNAQFDGAVLKDGVYTGEATGYRPGLQVSVEVSEGAVTSIEITDHNEVNSRFYAAPIQIIPEEIIENQSLDVEMVSGATFTSVGIVNAVKDALSDALVSGELPEDLALPQNRGRRH